MYQTLKDSMTTDSLPYNPKNIIISESQINEIFGAYYSIKNANLFRCAMVHRSYCTRKNETIIDGNKLCPKGCLPLQDQSNERLEFLGDAVLNLIVGNYLYDRYYEENEGFLTKIRTKLVCGNMLAELCSKINISQYFIISKQLEETEGRNSTKILEDMFEAFLGAFFLDAGEDIKVVGQWLINVIENNVDFTHLIMNNENPKDSLIRYFQHTHGYIPKLVDYNIQVINGKKMFKVCLKDANDNVLGIGTGPSKKKAETDCAKSYLEEVKHK